MQRLPPKLRVATDIAAFAVRRSRLRILLVQRGPGPFEHHEGQWSLPGGFLEADEDLDMCAGHVLRRETGIAEARIHQFHAYGAPNRDPRQRVVSIAYLGLLKEAGVRPGSHASRAEWMDIDTLPGLAFDHGLIVNDALRELRRRLSTTGIAFALLPDLFTLSELQTVHEAVMGEPIDKRNFRRSIMLSGLVKETPHFRSGVGRPAQLFVAA